MVCLPVSQLVSVTVMKNWLPLVPGPALAMASLPGGLEVVGGSSWFRRRSGSQGRPCQVPSGSPPWIMKFGITRWKMVPVVELGAFLGARVPLLGAFGEADEVGDGLGGVLLEELDDDGYLRWS